MAETATKSSSLPPLQKHSLGGSTIDVPPRRTARHRRQAHIVSPRAADPHRFTTPVLAGHY